MNQPVNGSSHWVNSRYCSILAIPGIKPRDERKAAEAKGALGVLRCDLFSGCPDGHMEAKCEDRKKVSDETQG